jgi:hypothetical protein
MTIKEREKKLAHAEAGLKRTTTRIRRLMNIERRWYSAVVYHRYRLTHERNETQTSGRMFRSYLKLNVK